MTANEQGGAGTIFTPGPVRGWLDIQPGHDEKPGTRRGNGGETYFPLSDTP